MLNVVFMFINIFIINLFRLLFLIIEVLLLFILFGVGIVLLLVIVEVLLLFMLFGVGIVLLLVREMWNVVLFSVGIVELFEFVVGIG